MKQKIFGQDIGGYNNPLALENDGVDTGGAVLQFEEPSNMGGGGGGIPRGGGGGSVGRPIEKPIDKVYVKVVGGCMDKKARNFSPNATYDDGSCVYLSPPALPVVLDYNAPVRVDISVVGQTAMAPASIFVDGVDTGFMTPFYLKFTEKELLTPKIVRVKKSGYQSTDEYRIKSVQRTFEKEIKPIVPSPTPIISLSDRPLPKDDFLQIDRKVISDQLSTENFLFNSNIGSSPLQMAGFGNQAVPNIRLDEKTYLGYSKPVLSTTKPQTTLVVGKTVFKYFEIQVEKKIDNKWVIQPSPTQTQITDVALRNKSVQLRLQFSLSQEAIEKDDEDVVVGDIETKEEINITKYSVRIIGDVPSDRSISFRTNYGQTGFVLQEEDIISFTIEQQPTFDIPYIEFFGNGSINDFTYKTSYEYQVNGKEVSNRFGTEQKYELRPGVNDFSVVLSKNIIATEAAGRPVIKVDRNTAVFNIADPRPISISYKTLYSDSVTYSIGKLKRTIAKSGTITLGESDFPNGLGQYTLYLQPTSDRAGSGDIEKVVITVESKAYLPGPDITHINYPQNIKGRDFTEYNVPFEISWQSVNTNYVHVYVGKVEPNRFLGKFSPAGSAEFNVAEVLRKGGDSLDSNRNISQLSLILVPWNIEGDEATEGAHEIIGITFDKGDLKLRRANVVKDIINVFQSQLNIGGFEEYTSPFLTHYLHLGGGDNKLIGTWGIDDYTFAEEYRDNNNQIQYRGGEKSIVLKLYEPLPRNITPNDKVWISKIQSIPLIDQITIVDDVVSVCTPLTPNFDLDMGDDIGYQILDDLVSSGSVSSTDVINEYVSSSGINLHNLDIQFVTQSSFVYTYEDGSDYNGSIVKKDPNTDYNWKEFVKYSSADERVRNFYYKVQLIEHYNNKYQLLTSGSGTTEWTGSIAVLNEANKHLVKINEVKNGFDSFEKWLYTSSSIDGLTYPGAGLNELSSSTDSSVISWFNGIIASAEDYDKNNTSRLVYNLPKHIVNDENSSEFILFFDMVGQHFDIMWSYINGISRTKSLEHKKEIGITNELIYHMLESLGWDADTGVKSQFLWEYAFGKHSDGTQVSSMSGKDRQQEIWRRILNNLPYLYKHKGTKRAIHAALSCYGIPASLLTVMEFGGPKDPTQSGTTKFTFDDRTAAINISGSAAISVPWKEFTNDYSTDYPNSIELRLNTETRQDQEIISGSQWSLHLLKDTGSMAHLELRVSGSGTLYSASTDSGSFFNDEFTQIVVNKETTNGNDVFTFYGKEGFQERIRTNVSGSLTVSGVSGWTSGSEIKIGGSTLTASVDELRLWRTPLSESRIDNHTLLPDAIDGNHISASTTDLIFRNDFEYPKNRYSSTDIKNVALVTSYTTASIASGFENSTSYPYQYTPYDRTVTADVPSSGFNVGNKVRFESQTKILDLSYRTRATKKSYDQAPVDSNKLGLFFSPIKEINMDILKSLGSFNIDNYIGNPQDEYSYEYKDLRTLRNYYFDRFSLNLYEYIQLVRYIDKSLFDVLESLVPARAKVSSGLLIEPHILERSKTEWKRPSGTKDNYESSINVDENINLISTNDQYLTVISASMDTNLIGENTQYDVTINADSDVRLSGNKDFYSTTIDTESDINLVGSITRNSGSDMGGISITIDAEITGSVQGQYESTAYIQVGMEPDSISNLGFGLYGSGSHTIRTRLSNNNFIKERVKVYLLKESYTELVPTISGSVGGTYYRLSVPQNEEIVKYKYKVNILPFTGSDGLETTDPSVSGNIVEVTPLNGYYASHYRNVGDLTSGLENSFFNGSKQTSATTLDGSSPVQTFTTNPNTLRVSDSGRGSGEPILEVD